MIGAVLIIAKECCQQVVYADLLIKDACAFGCIPSVVPASPKTMAEAGQKGLKFGICTGSYLVKKAQTVGVSDSLISTFPDIPSLTDGLAAKRIQLALSTYSSLRDLRETRNNLFDISSIELPDRTRRRCRSSVGRIGRSGNDRRQDPSWCCVRHTKVD